MNEEKGEENDERLIIDLLADAAGDGNFEH